MRKHGDHGKFNDARNPDAHPQAFQALVDLGNRAAAFLRAHPAGRKPRKIMLKKFHRWLEVA